MNDSEARRRELLRQTRKLYQDQRTPPAVHPRYGHIYHELYEPETPVSKSSFLYRLTLGILCFLCYVWMDQKNVSVADVNSSQIVQQIEKQIDWEELEEAWQSD